MAGMNRVELAADCLKNYIGKELFLETLKAIIEKNLSSSEKTVLEYLRLMRTQSLIQETFKKGISKWLILPQEYISNAQCKLSQRN